MSKASQVVRIKQPMPGMRWVVLVPLLVLTGESIWRGQQLAATISCSVLLLLLLTGKNFELDVTYQRYREGYHWAHQLNSSWQSLPPIRGVLVKTMVYRKGVDNKYSWTALGGIRRGYTILLSVPHSPQGVVVASVEDEAEAEAIAAQVADALQVSWQRA